MASSKQFVLFFFNFGFYEHSNNEKFEEMGKEGNLVRESQKVSLDKKVPKWRGGTSFFNFFP